MIFTIGAVSSKMGLSKLLERPPRSTKLAGGGGPDVLVMSGRGEPSLLGLALGPPSLHALGSTLILPMASATREAISIAKASIAPTMAAQASVEPLPVPQAKAENPSHGSAQGQPSSQGHSVQSSTPTAAGEAEGKGQIGSKEEIP